MRPTSEQIVVHGSILRYQGRMWQRFNVMEGRVCVSAFYREYIPLPGGGFVLEEVRP